jgi:hypothetical protein
MFRSQIKRGLVLALLVALAGAPTVAWAGPRDGGVGASRVWEMVWSWFGDWLGTKGGWETAPNRIRAHETPTELGSDLSTKEGVEIDPWGQHAHLNPPTHRESG